MSGTRTKTPLQQMVVDLERQQAERASERDEANRRRLAAEEDKRTAARRAKADFDEKVGAVLSPELSRIRAELAGEYFVDAKLLNDRWDYSLRSLKGKSVRPLALVIGLQKNERLRIATALQSGMMSDGDHIEEEISVQELDAKLFSSIFDRFIKLILSPRTVPAFVDR
jgi:hypothetical protein